MRSSSRQNEQQEQKKKLFSHSQSYSDGSMAIKQMKTVTSHLKDSRDLLHKSLDQLSHINQSLANTSSNLEKTNSMYDDYDDKTKKASLFIKQLRRRQANNARNIKLSFFFLIFTSIYVILRRIIFPDLYRIF